MTFVLDASTVLAWVFEDERHSSASVAYERIRTEQALVPGIWWFEVRNVLVLGERSGRLSEADTANFLLELSRLRIATDFAPDEATVLLLARRHRLTVYDAAYLELALRETAPLATLDRGLARAARATKIALV